MSDNTGPSEEELEEWVQTYKKLREKEQEKQDCVKFNEDAKKKAKEYQKYKGEKEAKGQKPMDFKDWLDFIKPISYDP